MFRLWVKISRKVDFLDLLSLRFYCPGISIMLLKFDELISRTRRFPCKCQRIVARLLLHFHRSCSPGWSVRRCSEPSLGSLGSSSDIRSYRRLYRCEETWPASSCDSDRSWRIPWSPTCSRSTPSFGSCQRCGWRCMWCSTLQVKLFYLCIDKLQRMYSLSTFLKGKPRWTASMVGIKFCFCK